MDEELKLLWAAWVEQHSAGDYAATRAIEEKIVAAKVEGIDGVAVKLALAESYATNYYDDLDEVAARSAYRAIVEITGVDLAAQVPH